jgi:hypothetical protein
MKLKGNFMPKATTSTQISKARHSQINNSKPHEFFNHNPKNAPSTLPPAHSSNDIPLLLLPPTPLDNTDILRLHIKPNELLTANDIANTKWIKGVRGIKWKDGDNGAG